MIRECSIPPFKQHNHHLHHLNSCHLHRGEYCVCNNNRVDEAGPGRERERERESETAVVIDGGGGGGL